MKFGSSWVIGAPCKKDGIECPKREFGCRNTCKEYAEYEQRLSEFKHNIFVNKTKERELDHYVKRQMVKMNGGKKYER